jgi:hypothetical protein
MEEKLNILVDEIRKAEKVAKDEYSYGYLDGLSMALSILNGLTD